MKFWRRSTDGFRPCPATAPVAGPVELYDASRRRASASTPRARAGFRRCATSTALPRRKRLQLIPDFFYAPVFSPARPPGGVWDGHVSATAATSTSRRSARSCAETPSFAEELARCRTIPPEDAVGLPLGQRPVQPLGRLALLLAPPALPARTRRRGRRGPLDQARGAGARGQRRGHDPLHRSARAALAADARGRDRGDRPRPSSRCRTRCFSSLEPPTCSSSTARTSRRPART